MKKLLLFGIISAVFISCIPTRKHIYTSTNSNLLTTEKKNDIIIGGDVALAHSLMPFANFSIGTDLQSAYAFTDNIVLKADYYGKSERNNYYEDTTNILIKYKKRGFETSLGYQNILKSNNTFFSLFGGFGNGKLSFNQEDKTNNNILANYFHQMNYNKFFVQPIFTYHNKLRTINFSLSPKLSFINFKNIQTDLPSKYLISHAIMNTHLDKSVFFDGVLQLTVKHEEKSPVSFQLQGGFSSRVDKPETNEYYDVNGVWGSVGIALNINTFWKK